MPPPTLRLSTTVLLIALATAAAAPSALAKGKKSQVPKPQPKVEEPVAGSVLTKSEREMNCKRMAGRMQVRILELRGAGSAGRGSGLAQGLQSAAQPIFGGTRRGADTAGDAAHDIAKLREMNTILKSKGCPHYDLQAELAKDAKAPTPRLVKGGSGKDGKSGNSAKSGKTGKGEKSAKSGGGDFKAKAEALAEKAKAWSASTTQKAKPAAKP